MTALGKRKTALSFITEDCKRYRGKLRRVVIEVHRSGMTGDVRLEGTKTRFAFSFTGLYDHAVAVAVEKERAAKKAAGRPSRARR